MSSSLHSQLFTKDLYKLLHISRTSTTSEIKQSYRRIALALHPDKHNGCSIKTSEFQQVTDAYNILSNYTKRIEYDRWLDGVVVGEDGVVRKGGVSSRAAERNPFYRKVYSPAAPPGMKTFDRQRHYDMHYGQGMMKEEIERARKRAEAASPRKSGYSYQSPLGAGFSFETTRPLNQQMNPYSRKGKRQHDHVNKHGGIRIEYEEAYFDMNGMDLMESKQAMRGKETIVKRMSERRKNRVRERGEPNPYHQQQSREGGGGGRGVESGDSACIIM